LIAAAAVKAFAGIEANRSITVWSAIMAPSTGVVVGVGLEVGWGDGVGPIAVAVGVDVLVGDIVLLGLWE
jgi:hypothetical protein